MGSLLDVTARAVDQLGGASTAEQAIATDANNTWKTLTKPAEDYASLRAAQEWVMTHCGLSHHWASSRPQLGGEDHANLLYIRNLDEL